MTPYIKRFLKNRFCLVFGQRHTIWFAVSYPRFVV